jgi:hypothetical protein
MTGSLVVAFILAVIGTIWQGAAYFSLFVATLMICLLIAAYRVWRDEYHAGIGLQDKIATFPIIEILEQTEITDAFHRIRITNLSDAPCIVGVELAQITPRVSLVLLPLPLQITNELFGQARAVLPGRQSRLIDVFEVIGGDRLRLLGAAPQAQPVIPSGRYELTISAHGEGTTSAPRRTFVAQPEIGIGKWVFHAKCNAIQAQGPSPNDRASPVQPA